MRKKIKVVVDTNWWISFVINKYKGQLAEILLNPHIVFINSRELQEEIYATLDSDKLRKYVREDLKQEFKTVYPKFTKMVKITSEITICRDPKDNFLLALSVDSAADYLITGDADLLVLQNIGKTTIVKMSDFVAALRHF